MDITWKASDMLYENKISAQFRIEIIHLNKSHQLKCGYCLDIRVLVPTTWSTLGWYFSSTEEENWTSNRLDEVQGATWSYSTGKKSSMVENIKHITLWKRMTRVERAQKNHSVCTSTEIKCIQQHEWVTMLWTLHTDGPVTVGCRRLHNNLEVRKLW